MTEMFGEAWPLMSVPDLAPDDDDDDDPLMLKVTKSRNFSFCPFALTCCCSGNV